MAKKKAPPCPPEWVVKSVVRNTNMHTIGWSAAALEALVQQHQIAPGQAVVFVNRACNRVRVVVRATLDVVYLIMCPVDAEAVVWNSPHQVLLYFTRWLYDAHGADVSEAVLAGLIETLEHGEAWFDEVGYNGVRRRSPRKAKVPPCAAAATTIKQTVINANVK